MENEVGRERGESLIRLALKDGGWLSKWLLK